jgi:hypothetical protein
MCRPPLCSMKPSLLESPARSFLPCQSGPLLIESHRFGHVKHGQSDTADVVDRAAETEQTILNGVRS